MTNPTQPVTRKQSAFTLIEMIVVISIIGVLAALIFPVVASIKKRATITKAQTELEQVVTAIDSYKAKYNHYPPDSPNGPITNQLYFELSGTVFINLPPWGFQTLDGSARLGTNAVATTFGAGVGGFVNCSRGGGGDDAVPAENFLKSLKPGQYGEISAGVRLLACSVPWPVNSPYQPVPANPGLNPWRYVSSNPTYNPGSYDLWVDVLIGGKTNRVSNWSKQPQLVGTP
jgi:prepilin-type N-terminal cleavage/methylation domain-containing protein